MEIWVDENIPNGREIFEPYGHIETFSGRSLNAKNLVGTEALVVRSITKVDRILLEKTQVKFVGTATIGTDHIDLDYLKQAGIGFSSAPGCNSASVGDYITAALLRFEQLSGRPLSNQILGVIGYGNVGKNVTSKAEALGLRVIRTDPPLEEKEPGKHTLHNLSHLQAQADIITMHLPLTQSGSHPTFKLAESAFFNAFQKPIAFLNSGRGQTADEQALLTAKKQGQITQLDLDVWSTEPAINRELCGLCDIATPHIAGYSHQGKQNGSLTIMKAMSRFFNLPLHHPKHLLVPKNPSIHFDENPEDFLRHAVNRCYPILEDDARLRNSLKTDNPGRAFDSLRKNYPVRHEFSQYTVCGIPENKTRLRAALSGLGFQVKD